jgi:hypothetical protein
MGLHPIIYYPLNDTTPIPNDGFANTGAAGALGYMFDEYSANYAPTHRAAAGPIVAETNMAPHFDGASNYTFTPYGLAVDPSSVGGIPQNPQAPFTVEAWLNPDNATPTTACALAFGQFVLRPYSGWLMYQNGNSWEWQMYDGTNTAGTPAAILDSDSTPTPGTWNHVAMVWDGTNASLSVDGVLKAGPVAVPTFAPVNYFTLVTSGNFITGPTIGERSDIVQLSTYGASDTVTGTSFPWAGYAAEVAYYTNALSQATLLSHYQNGVNSGSAPGSYETLVQASHPLLFYVMNDPGLTTLGTAGTVTTRNYGSLGSPASDGTYEPGTAVVPGLPYAGFGPNHTAVNFAGIGYLAGAGTYTNSGIMIPPMNGVVVNTFTFTCWVYERTPIQYANNFFWQRGNGDVGVWANNWFNPPDQLATIWSGAPTNGVLADYGVVWPTSLLPATNFWNFVATVWTPTNVTVYVNGAASLYQTSDFGSSQGTSIHFPRDFSAGTLWLCSDPANTGIVAPFIMDEAAFFTNALTAAQLQGLVDASGLTPEITSLSAAPAALYDAGQSVSLIATVFASSSNYSAQWYKSGAPTGTPIDTFTPSNILALSNLQASDSGTYTLVVTNRFGASTSAPLVLHVEAGSPMISQQPTPAAVTRFINGSVTFTAAALGSLPLSYQWQHGTSPISGATATSLSLTGVQPADAGSYNVVVSNLHGSVTSSNAVLTVTTPSAAYPSAIVSLGPQAYWRLNETTGTNANDFIGGLTGTVVGGVTLAQPGPSGASYPGLESDNTSFLFDGSSGVIDTPLLINGEEGTFTALVNVPAGGIFLPGILDARGGPGSSCSLELYTDGVTLMYTWANAPDTWGWSTTANLTGLQVTPGAWCFVAASVGQDQTILYVDNGNGLLAETNEVVSVGVTNTGQMVIGRDPAFAFFNGGIDEAAYFNRALTPAEVMGLDRALFAGAAFGAPVISVQPVPQSVYPGGAASFTVSVMGALPLSYQWQFDNANIPGATAASLVIPSVAESNAGSYQVVVSNSFSAVTSLPADLRVLTPPVLGVPGNVTYGLVGHYKFDGDFTDSSGFGHDGVPYGSPPFIAGKIGSGAIKVSDDQVSIYQCVALGNPADFQFNAGDSFSVSFWLNYIDTPGDLPIIGNSVNATGNTGWVLADSFYDDGGGNITCSIEGLSAGAYFQAVNPAGPMNDGKWHHFVLVNDQVRGVINAYTDGVLANAVVAIGLGSLNLNRQIVIGNDPTLEYNGANAAGGYSVDDVGIWRRALTTTEVAGIYAAGTNGSSFDTYGPVLLTTKLTGANQLQITWQEGRLESASSLTGPWTPVAGVTAPSYVVTPTNSQQFYRVR